MEAAADNVPAALRPEVGALAELVEGGRSPGDAVLATARAAGAHAALLAAAEPEIEEKTR
jgi:glutamate--cysteine ligase